MQGTNFVKEVEKALDKLFEKIKADFLIFFNEKDLHFVFHTILLNSFDSKEVKIVREYPCDRRVQKEGIGKNIDFGLDFPTQFQETFRIGIEFGMEKVTDAHEREWGGKRYFIRKNPEAKKKIPLIMHMKHDAEKLKSVKGVNCGFLVNYIFCISDSKNLSDFKELIDKRKVALKEVAPQSGFRQAFTSILYTIVVAKDGEKFQKMLLCHHSQPR